MISKQNIKALFASMLMFSSSAEAVIVLQQASSSFGTQYDTNPLLREEDSQSIWRHTITPKYIITAVENQNKWFVDAGLLLQRSSNERVLQDRQDPNFDAGWVRENEKGQFSITAHYDKRSSRFSEFNQNGLVDVDGSAITKSLSADWSRAITERLTYSIGSQYTNTTYDSSRFSDFVSKSINSSLSYQFSERISPFIQVGYNHFKSDGIITGNGLLIDNNNGLFINNVGNAGDSTSKNISIGATILLSPLWTLTSSIGLNKVDTNNQNSNTVLNASSGAGKIGSLSLIRVGERSNFSSVISRSVSSSGIGGFVESDQFNTSYDYSLSERSAIGGSYGINKNKSVFAFESTVMSAFYTKELTEMWRMRLSVERRNRKNFNQDVDGNVVGLTFTYSTPEF